MPEVIYTTNSSELSSIANAIREKTGGDSPLAFPDEFVQAVASISGDSDFSTAQVTVIGEANLEMPTLLIVPEANLEGTFIEPFGDSPYTVILYKGKAYLGLSNPESISGNIEYDEDTHLYVITGDCTINFGSIG